MNELFRKYRAAILSDEQLPPPLEVEEALSLTCLKRVEVMGWLYLPLNCYYLIADFLGGLYSEAYGTMNMQASLMGLFISLYIILISRIPRLRRHLMLVRFSLLAFYIGLVVMVFLYSVSFNYRTYAAGIPVSYTGLPLSTLYLLSFVISPLPNKKDSCLLLTSMFVGMVLSFVMPGHQMISVFSQFSLRFMILVGYWHVWNSNHHMAKRDAEALSLNEQLLQYSYVDNLTGALNRNALDRFVAHLMSMAPQPSVSVIMLDVDFFKLYNDHYSHKAGDKVLAAITSAICDSLGEKDPYLFRYGGEEFLVLALGQTDESLVALAQKYRQAVAGLQIPRADGAPLDHVTISIGCAHLNVGDSFSKDFISSADTQLYFAKDSGRDCISFRNNLYH